MKYTFLILAFFFHFSSCKKDNTTPSSKTSTAATATTKQSSNPMLENYLKKNCSYIHNIEGFYIVGSDEKPDPIVTTPGTTAKEIFDHSVRLFSNFLDQDQDGVIDPDKKTLSKWLAKHLIFISGHLKFVDKISFSPLVESNKLYGMSMQTDNWDYVKSYTGKGWTFTTLNSSTWRPDPFNALWEETFHTITEAYSRADKEFKFTVGGKLRKYLEDDIAAGTYDISKQNKEEKGQYDKVTAVNEYIHQIWAIHFAGYEKKLNSHQLKALNFMKSKGVPMTLNPNYNKIIGKRIK